MAETVHISQMAEKISDELFYELLWEKVGPTNQNWKCEEPEQHGVETHPSDVVFYYDEPYSQVRTYINCDLKSYAKNSIKPTAIFSATISLAKQVACAEKSDEWRKLYVHDHVTPEICGLLFVYNHDGEYDKDFHKMLHMIKPEKLDLPKNSKLVILGPEDIFWLDNIRYEIRQMRSARGSNRLPDREYCQYFHPQLVTRANVQVEKAKAATLEMITSPWIILEHKGPKPEDRHGLVIFYRRSGETEQEFMYLFDYLRHYQIISDTTDVQVKALNSAAIAPAIFDKAVQHYIEEMCEGNNENDFALLVKKIKFSKISQVISQFSEIELGMGNE